MVTYPVDTIFVDHGAGVKFLPNAGVVGIRGFVSTVGGILNVVRGEHGMAVLDALDDGTRTEIISRKHDSLIGGLESYGLLVKVFDSTNSRGVYCYVGVVARQTRGIGSKTCCHVFGTFGIDSPGQAGSFLIRLENINALTTRMVDAIISHVLQGHLIRQTNNAAFNNVPYFQYSRDGGITWTTVKG